jgi:type III secretion protein Q
VLVADCLMALHPSLEIDAVDETMLGMLIESLFAREFALLEAASCHSAAIARRHTSAEASGLAFRLSCIWGEASYPAVLCIDRALIGDLVRFIARAPLIRRDLSDVPIAPTIRIGTAVLLLKKVDTLKRGDVIMPHSPPLFAARAEIVLGGRWSAPGTLAGGCFTADAPLSKITEHVMDSENAIDRSDGVGPEDGALDELTVKLVFEVGRCDTTLGELRSMGAGYVFALGRDPEQSVDIVTGGRRIGSGELVRVGERLGVRVLRLSKDG